MASNHSKGKHAEDPRSRFAAAFERVRAEIAALSADEVITINVDVPHAATTVLGALPGILEQRDQLKEMPGFDVDKLDRLEDYALAVLDAQGARQIDVTPDARLPELRDEGSTLRALLFQDAHTLSSRRLIDGGRLADVKQSVGYETLAVDLISLAKLFREAWVKVEGKMAVTMAEIERAEALASALAFGIGARNTTPTTVTDAALTRQKAFTLIANVYGEARAALAYLRRREGDLESVAPSLYASRVAKKKKGDSLPPGAETPAPGAVVSPTVTPTAPGTTPIVDDGV